MVCDFLSEVALQIYPGSVPSDCIFSAKQAVMSLQIETDTWGQSWSLKTTSHAAQSLEFGLQSWAVVHMCRALSPLILPPYLIIIFMNLSIEIRAIKSNINSQKGKDTCMRSNIFTKQKANSNWNLDEATSTQSNMNF